MSCLECIYSWVVRGGTFSGNPGLAFVVETAMPLITVMTACLAGGIAIVMRNSSVIRCVTSLMGAIALFGVAFFVLRMIGFYTISSQTEFAVLASGIAHSWQAVGILFGGIALGLVSVLTASALTRQASSSELALEKRIQARLNLLQKG